MLNSLFFHSPTQDVVIKQEHLDIVRHLVAHEDTTSSGYAPSMLQWRISDNDTLTEANLDDIYIAMQFIVMCAEMTDTFKAKYDVKPYHETLLRRLYLEQDGDEDDLFITTGFKRPFGNSHVLGDVAEEMHRFGIDVYEDDEYTILENICEAEYSKFISILEAFMQEFIMTTYYFSPNNRFSPGFKITEIYNWDKRLGFNAHHYLDSWIPSVMEERNSKIETIIK